MNLNDLFDQPSCAIIGELNSERAKEFHQQSKKVVAEVQELDSPQITVVVSTNGGFWAYARTMYEEIRMLNHVALVNIVVIGHCQSAGNLLLMAVPPEQRFASRQAKFMLHSSYDEITAVPSLHLEAREAVTRERVAHLQAERVHLSWMMRVLAAGTGLSVAEISQLTVDVTWWTAKQAVQNGLVGALVQERYSRKRKKAG
jgi:ATP-dependent protease ClpP protease subunit